MLKGKTIMRKSNHGIIPARIHKNCKKKIQFFFLINFRRIHSLRFFTNRKKIKIKKKTTTKIKEN